MFAWADLLHILTLPSSALPFIWFPVPPRCVACHLHHEVGFLLVPCLSLSIPWNGNYFPRLESFVVLFTAVSKVMVCGPQCSHF